MGDVSVRPHPWRTGRPRRWKAQGRLRIERRAAAGDEAQIAAQALVQLAEQQRADVDARPLLRPADDLQAPLERLAAALRVGLGANGADHNVEQRRHAGEDRRLHLRQPVAHAHEVIFNRYRRANGQRQQELDGEGIGVVEREQQQDAIAATSTGSALGTAATLDMKLRCLSITPFAPPVVPDV